MRSDEGKTALMYAIDNSYNVIENKNTARILLDNGADANKGNDRGKTVLMLAVISHLYKEYKEERVNIVRVLLSRADVNARDNSGNTVLILAVKNSLENIVQLLLNNGADINIKNRGRETALKIAQEKGYTEIITLLTSSTIKE